MLPHAKTVEPAAETPVRVSSPSGETGPASPPRDPGDVRVGTTRAIVTLVLAGAVIMLPPTLTAPHFSRWPDLHAARARVLEARKAAKTPPSRSDSGNASADGVEILYPPNGGVVTGDEVTVVWRSRVQRAADDEGQLALRRPGTGKFEFLPARPGPHPSVRLARLEPDTTYELFTTIRDKHGDLYSELHTFRTQAGAVFAQRVYPFPAELTARQDNLRFPVEVRNRSDRPVLVHVQVRPTVPDIAAAVVGLGGPQEPVVIGPHEVWTLSLVVHAGRASGGVYYLPLNLYQTTVPGEAAALVDRTVVQVTLPGPSEPRLEYHASPPEPVTGAVTVTLINVGADLTDLTVTPEGELFRQVRLEPEVQSVPLPAGGRLSLRVVPILSPNQKPLTGHLRARTGGSRGPRILVPVALTVPEGLRVHTADGPSWQMSRAVCRLPTGGGTLAAVNLTGPTGEVEFVGWPEPKLDARPSESSDHTPGMSTAKGAAQRAAWGVGEPVTSRPPPWGDGLLIRPDSEADALSRPPDPEGQSLQRKALPKVLAKPNTPSQSAGKPRKLLTDPSADVARSRAMMDTAVRLVAWSGQPAGAVATGLLGTDSAAWCEPSFITLARAETDRVTSRRTVWLTTITMSRFLRPPFQLTEPDRDAHRTVLDYGDLGRLSAGWVSESVVSGGPRRLMLRSSNDLGSSWSATTAWAETSLPVVDHGLCHNRDTLLAWAVVGHEPSPHPRRVGPVDNEPTRLLIAVVGLTASGNLREQPTALDLGPARAATVLPSAEGFELIVQSPAGRLLSRRLDADGRSLGQPTDLGPGCRPSARRDRVGVLPRPVFRLWYLDPNDSGGPAGEPSRDSIGRILMRSRASDQPWSAPVVASGDYTDCRPPKAARFAGESGAVFVRASRPDRSYITDSLGRLARLADEVLRVTAAWLALDFQQWPAAENTRTGQPDSSPVFPPPSPSPLDVRVNGAPVGRIPDLRGTGTWWLPVDPALLRTGPLGRHRVELSVPTLRADPIRCPVLCGVRLITVGSGPRLVLTADQAEADRLSVQPWLLGFLWDGHHPARVPTSELSSRRERIVLPEFRAVGGSRHGREPTLVKLPAKLELPGEPWQSVWLRVPLEGRLAWPAVTVTPTEAASRYRVSWFTEDGCPQPPPSPERGPVESSVLILVECKQAGKPAQLLLASPDAY